MFGNKIPTSIQNAFLPHFSSSVSLQTPLPHPCCYCGSPSVPLEQQQMAQGLRSEHSGFSAVLNSFPLFLCWSSMGCRPCSTGIVMEKLPLTWPCYSLVLSSFPCLLPVQPSCPFLNTLSWRCHHVISVAQLHPEWACWSWQEAAVSENREEQNIVIFFLGAMSKSVIFKIHFVSVSLWTWRSSDKLQWNPQWLLQAAKRLMWPNHWWPSQFCVSLSI